MKITWIGHACLLIETSKTKCLTDPWLSDPIFGGSVRHIPPRAHSFEDLPPIDLICLTHAHFDHFHTESLTRFDRNITIIIPPSPVRDIKGYLHKMGFKNVVELPPWKTHDFQDLKVTSIPSVGVPEEVAFIIEGEGTTVLDGADCNYDPVVDRIAKKFSVDISFIPFCGWDHTGLMGLEPTKKWKPNYQEISKSCMAIGTKYVVAAASNAFWYPEELRWLNDRVSPGVAQELMEVVREESHGQIVPLAMNPGDQWLSEEKRVVAFQGTPSPAEAPTGEAWETWLQDSRLKIYSLDELTQACRKMIVRRRRELLRRFFKSPKIISFLLKTRFDLSSSINGQIQTWHVDLTGWNPLRLGTEKPKAQFGLLVKWEDLCALIQGLVDTQDLNISHRLRLYYLRKSEEFKYLFGLEYIFFFPPPPDSRSVL